MTRVPVSALGGIALALALFWLLALLVAPPEAEVEMLDTTLAMTMVEAPEVAQEEAAEPAAQAPPPPPPAAVPPPAPELAPLESPIALPDPEPLPEDDVPLELDETLPEMSEVTPEPPPPEPEPEAQPQPEPEAQPEPSPVAESTEVAPDSAATRQSDVQADSQTPVDVGQLSPTSRVPPEYPARAQRRGLEGFVELRFVIRPDGSVDPSSVQVTSAQPRNVFDRAAIEAVQRWQFEPAGGLRRAQQRLEFQLR
ncbi:TonB family protein [Franzmannia qiaohouensis]|uniref:Protein TonB n=1 Tax=Franzmannia qiaohouensis TaxID=1329370 RepID=A0ABU1HGL8_9GAMM|nr:TonB family protein [Halomonas qiaohouensis]MDR5906618.1 TonB family protein [Halomonas qiaohouensis]